MQEKNKSNAARGEERKYLYNTAQYLWENYGKSYSAQSPTGAVSVLIHEDGTVSNSREALARFSDQRSARKILKSAGFKITPALGCGPLVKNLNARFTKETK